MTTKSPFAEQITFLYCSNLDETASFYRDLLGLPLALDQGACRIFRVTDSAFIGLCHCSEGRSVTRDGVTFTFVCEDVDGWHEKLVANRVEIVDPPKIREAFGIYRFFARDPEGHLIEFQRFLDPDWPSG